MTDKICHLCGTPYNDDPYFREQPAHTPQKCLGILQYRKNKVELELHEIEKQLTRAKLEYAMPSKKKRL